MRFVNSLLGLLSVFKCSQALMSNWETDCQWFLDEGNFYLDEYSNSTFIPSGYYSPTGECNYMNWYGVSWSYTCVENATTGDTAVMFQVWEDWQSFDCSGDADIEWYFSDDDYSMNCDMYSTMDCTLGLDVHWNPSNSSCDPKSNASAHYSWVNGACSPQYNYDGGMNDGDTGSLDGYSYFACDTEDISYVTGSWYSGSDDTCTNAHSTQEVADNECPDFDDEIATYAYSVTACEGDASYTTQPLTSQTRAEECSWLLFFDHYPMVVGGDYCYNLGNSESIATSCYDGEVYINWYGDSDCDSDDTQQGSYASMTGQNLSDVTYNCDGQPSFCDVIDYWHLEWNTTMDAFSDFDSDACADEVTTNDYTQQFPVVVDLCYYCSQCGDQDIWIMLSCVDFTLDQSYYWDDECTDWINETMYENEHNFTDTTTTEDPMSMYGECDYCASITTTSEPSIGESSTTETPTGAPTTQTPTGAPTMEPTTSTSSSGTPTESDGTGDGVLGNSVFYALSVVMFVVVFLK